MLSMGKSSPVFYQKYEYAYPHVLTFKKELHEFLSNWQTQTDIPANLPKEMLVFQQNHDLVYSYFLADAQDENPPVYCIYLTLEEKIEHVKIYDRLSDFFIEQAERYYIYHLANGRASLYYEQVYPQFTKSLKYEISACTSQEIEDMKLSQGVDNLPYPYTEFMQVMGKITPNSPFSNIVYPNVASFKKQAEEWLSQKTSSIQIPQDGFVFYADPSTDTFYYFHTNNGLMSDPVIIDLASNLPIESETLGITFFNFIKREIESFISSST